MIKKSLTLIFILFCFCGFSQKTIQKKIESVTLKTTRNIKIYIPEGYEKDSIKNYPLTIVLDEEYLFDMYVGNSILFAKKDTKLLKYQGGGFVLLRTTRILNCILPLVCQFNALERY